MTGPLYLDFETLHRLFHPSTPPPEDDPVIDPDIHHDDPIDREVTA